MTPTADHIARVTSKVAKLIRALRALEKDNEKLRGELERRTAAEEELKMRHAALEQQVSLLKASAGESDDPSRKDLEKTLNQYIKEIDRCIALLVD